MEFVEFVSTNGLQDVDLNNGKFTWTNWHKGFTNIAERIDRFLLGGLGMKLNGYAKLKWCH